MCGIAGIISLKIIPTESLNKMIVALNKRGPDGSGIWANEEKNCSLAHTRLSIIDLSHNANQPMSILNGRYWITYNGEVYNYKELRTDLEAEGAIFKSDSDTEVILWGWHFHGSSFLGKIRGMFAFGLRDEHRKRTYLVRDRIGIKPLVYHLNKDKIVFASTISALLASGEVEKRIDNLAIFDLLIMGAVAQPRTIIEKTLALEPGSIVIVNDSLEVAKERYWDLSEIGLQPKIDKSFNYVALELRSKLEEACRYHLISDVPVGSFMSGGVDSTVITALMTRLSGKQINTFTIGFESKSNFIHELEQASVAARYLGTKHHEVILKGSNVADDFDKFIDSIDQPSIDGLNTYWVSKVTSNVVKVAISGLGADELFAGYDSFLMVKKASESKSTMLDYVLGTLYDHISNRFTFNAAIKISDRKFREAFFRKILKEGDIRPLLSDTYREQLNPDHFKKYVAAITTLSEDSVNQYSKFELQGYLLNILMRDTDSLSLSNSLEVRPIYLDHELVEYVLSLPGEIKLRNQITKVLLKEATKDLLPPGFFDRKKTGFSLPIYDWINNELKSIVLDTMSSSSSLDFFDQKAMIRLTKNISNPKYTKVVWLITVLTAWVTKTLK